MKQLALKRSLVLSSSSILVLLSVLVGQAYAAGSIPSLGAAPANQSISCGQDRRADWQWVAAGSEATVSVREYTGQHSWEYNNFPGLAKNVMRSAWWQYDSYWGDIPVTCENKWYGEGGNWIAPRWYRLSTCVQGGA